MGHIYLGEKPCPNLLGAGGFEEKLQGLQKVAPGLFHIVTLGLAISNSGHKATKPYSSRAISAVQWCTCDMSLSVP